MVGVVAAVGALVGALVGAGVVCAVGPGVGVPPVVWPSAVDGTISTAANAALATSAADLMPLRRRPEVPERTLALERSKLTC